MYFSSSISIILLHCWLLMTNVACRVVVSAGKLLKLLFCPCVLYPLRQRHSGTFEKEPDGCSVLLLKTVTNRWDSCRNSAFSFSVFEFLLWDGESVVLNKQVFMHSLVLVIRWGRWMVPGLRCWDFLIKVIRTNNFGRSLCASVPWKMMVTSHTAKWVHWGRYVTRTPGE